MHIDVSPLSPEFRRAADHIPGMVWTSQVDGHIDFLNRGWCEYTGMTMELACGWGWQAAIHPADLEGLLAIWRNVLSSGAPGSAEARLRRFDGQFRWFSFRAVPLHDEAGQVIKWYGQTVDIDDVKHAEALQAGENRILERVANGSSLDETLHSICQMVENEVLGLGFCAILLPDRRGQVQCVASAPRLPSPRRALIDRIASLADAGPCASATLLREKVVITDLASDLRWPRFAELSRQLGARSSILQPILSNDERALGTFVLFLSDSPMLTPRQLATVDQLTHLAALAIERRRVDSALRESEAALRASEERFTLAVAGSSDGIWDWDLVTDEMFLSDRAQILYGLEPGATLRPRAQWRRLIQIHPDDVDQESRLTEYHRGDEQSYDNELRVRHTNGIYRWVRVRGICVYDNNGSATRMAGSVSDVDPRRRAEAALLQVHRLEAAGTLAAGVAHDFNNILSAILGYSEMAMRDARPGTRLRRDLDSILVAAERGRSLVDRLLAFSRSDVAERIPVQVEFVVHEALVMLEAILPPQIVVEPRLDAGTAATLGDPTLVHQVFMNLATNAIQAMPDGGRLAIALERRDLEAECVATTGVLPAGQYIVLKVADTGIGIAPDIANRIFDPFFTTKEAGAGTGLGLSLVHGLVSSIGGAIEVASRPSEGSVFTVYWPYAGEVNEEYRSDPVDLPRGSGERILVVDDEAALVNLMTDTLEFLGYTVQGFASSPAAREALRGDPSAYDLLVTDERMPVLTGTELARSARAVRPDLPILMISGYPSASITALAREAGVAEVLRKPLGSRELALAVARQLRSGGADGHA